MIFKFDPFIHEKIILIQHIQVGHQFTNQQKIKEKNQSPFHQESNFTELEKYNNRHFLIFLLILILKYHEK